MRKIGKIGTLLATLLIGAGAAIGVTNDVKIVKAGSETATLTFTAACKGSGTDDKSNTWTVTSDAAESTYDSDRGIHYGTGSKAVSYLTLTSSAFSYQIEQVKVYASDGNATAKIDVKVGGVTFGEQSGTISATNAGYTFTPTTAQATTTYKGAVEVKISRSSVKKALYCKSIEVTYNKGGKSFDSISITGTATKTAYKAGETFDSAGLTVNANYSDSSFEDVTSKVTWEPSPLTVGTTSVTASYTEGATTKTATYDGITVAELSSISITGTATKLAYEDGDSFNPAGLTVTATYSDSSTADVTTNVTWEPNPLTTGTTSVTASYTAGEVTKTANYDGITVTANVKDVLTKAVTGISGTGYEKWSDVTAGTGVKYAGYSGGSNESIQLNNNTTNKYGIVSTSTLSGMKIASVTIDWNTNTASGRVLNVFGSNTAYTSYEDVYDSNKRGSIVGTIVKGTSTTLTFSSKYTYVGFQSNSGAMYLNSISIKWVEAPVEPEVLIDGGDKSLDAGDTGTFTATKTHAESYSVVWSSSDSSILEVNSSTGAYEAKKVGTVTLTATLGTTEYKNSVKVHVSGNMSVDEVFTAGSALESGVTTGYKVTVTGVLTKIEIKNNAYNGYFETTGGDTVQVFFGYTKPSGYDGWIVGGFLTVKANIQKYYSAIELVNNVIDTYTDDANEFAAWANTAYLDDDCEAKNVTAEHWNDMATEYAKLSAEAKAKLVAAGADYAYDTDVATFVARYDNIIAQSRYSGLTPFMEGRVAKTNSISNINSNNSMLIAVISIISISCIGAFFFVSRKRKLSK